MMAGYSGTPLAKKLGIKEGFRLAFVGAPEGFAPGLGPLPAGAEVVEAPARPLDLIVGFARSRADLARDFPRLAALLTPAGMLWIAWPKKGSGVATDLTENVVREVGLAAGLVDTKVCAIDEVWSGLRFVVRLRDRKTGA
jgi:hypothetical protein